MTTTQNVSEADITPEVHPPADSAGIGTMVPLAALAARPENPRTDVLRFLGIESPEPRRSRTERPPLSTLSAQPRREVG